MKRRSVIRRPTNWWAWFLLAVGGAMALSGCLVIPVNYYWEGSRHNISDKTQSELQVGVTTKEEVFLLLGEPDYASDDGQSIGYGWSKVKAVVALYNAAAEITRSYLVQIWFDGDNRVAGVDLVKAWGPRVPYLRMRRPE